LKRPTIALVVAINRAVRADDEWFDEPDDLDRVAAALNAIDGIEDPVVAAGVLAARLARSQAFGEGNKRTALLVARWVLDRNGQDGAAFVPPDDFALARLLVEAAAGRNVEGEVVALLQSRPGGL
jgi:prophage maintenance system killer protein